MLVFDNLIKKEEEKMGNNGWYILRNAVLCGLFVLLTLGGVNYILNDLWSKPAEPSPVSKVSVSERQIEIYKEAVDRCVVEPVLKTGTNPVLAINADLNVFSNQIAKKLEEIKQKQ